MHTVLSLRNTRQRISVQRRSIALGITVVAQGLASVTNVIFLLASARSLDRAEFGAVGIVFACYLFALGVARAVSGEPALVGRPFGESEKTLAEPVTAAFLLGLITSVGFGVIGLAIGGHLGKGLLLLALGLPVLLAQDAVRYRFFSASRPGASVLLDLVWLGLLLCGLAWIGVSNSSSPQALIGVWILGGAVGGVYALLKHLRRLVYGVRWVRDNRDLVLPYIGEFFISSGAAQILVVLLGIVASYEDVAAVRGSQTLFGPFSLLFTAFYVFFVPRSPAWSGTAFALEKRMVVLSLCFMVLGAAVMAVFLNLPDAYGEQILGSSWDISQSLVLPIGLSVIANGAAAGALTGLRSISAAKRSFLARILSVPAVILLPTLGAVYGGGRGFAWGHAAAAGMSIGIWWRQFWMARRGHEEDRAIGPPQTHLFSSH